MVPFAFHAPSGAWVAAHQPPDRRPAAPEVSVATYNVWFDMTVEPFTRWAALLAILERDRPDLLSLQEVTPPFLRLLLSQSWVRDGYVVSHVDEASVDPHAAILLSRYPVLGLQRIELPSAMGRALLLGVIDVGGHPLSFGGVHLESMRESAPTRAAQLAAVIEALEGPAPAILAGDLNFCSADPENQRIVPPWIDLWSTLRTGDHGWTKDAARNPMLARRAPFKKRRYDRILAWPAHRLTPVSIDLLGTEPIEATDPALRPSDHFGLLGRLARR